MTISKFLKRLRPTMPLVAALPLVAAFALAPVAAGSLPLAGAGPARPAIMMFSADGSTPLGQTAVH